LATKEEEGKHTKEKKGKDRIGVEGVKKGHGKAPIVKAVKVFQAILGSETLGGNPIDKRRSSHY